MKGSVNMHISSREEFEKKVIGAKEPVIVDFYADWCGPCRMMSPVIEKISKNAGDFSVYKVNVDEMPEVAAKYSIESIPAFVAFKGGKEVSRRIGAAPEGEILGMIAQ